jgi:hypothetical protein
VLVVERKELPLLDFHFGCVFVSVYRSLFSFFFSFLISDIGLSQRLLQIMEEYVCSDCKKPTLGQRFCPGCGTLQKEAKIQGVAASTVPVKGAKKGASGRFLSLGVVLRLY